MIMRWWDDNEIAFCFGCAHTTHNQQEEEEVEEVEQLRNCTCTSTCTHGK